MRSGKPRVQSIPLRGVIYAALCLSATTQALAWKHPGIGVSQDQLEATRAAYQAGNPVIVDLPFRTPEAPGTASGSN